MKKSCDVAIVGAGPYGLSLAAHLRARGLEFRVFGKPLDTWSRHMPDGMMLKSDGFASNLSAPAPDSTLKAYCARRGLAYGDQGVPVPLSQFLDYAKDFRERQVPDLETRAVTWLQRGPNGFNLTLDDGETLGARHVVLAVGITWFAFTPKVLASLSRNACTHSFAHRDVSRFKGCEVAVIGAGSSAIDLAHALHEAGARPRIVTRRAALDFNNVPDPAAETLIKRTLAPASGIGRGWRSFFCASAPLLFHRLPRHLKERAIESHMHPAGGWFMREKVEGVVPVSAGRFLAAARMKDDRALLTLADGKGGAEQMAFDHVIAATGYVPDLRKLPFLSPNIPERAAPEGGSPLVSENFETAVPGLYTIGLTAMASFGPLMRFMYGAEFAAPRLAGHLERKLMQPGLRRAA
jgi:cation diffusion facilitator CzcD-associated flavoprotein CzcO